MLRTARMIIPNEQAVYHVMSRTALDGFPIGGTEKDHLLQLIKRFSGIYFDEILGFCIMGNHFHILVKMLPESDFSDDDILKRCRRIYREESHLLHLFSHSDPSKQLSLVHFFQFLLNYYAIY